jgi:hypothetical protein
MPPVIISDDEAPVVSARPRRPIVLSSKLTDTNNDATPELASHRTAMGKTPGLQVTTQGTSRLGTGTKRVANDAPLNVDSDSDSDHANDEGTVKRVTAPKGTFLVDFDSIH